VRCPFRFSRRSASKLRVVCHERTECDPLHLAPCPRGLVPEVRSLDELYADVFEFQLGLALAAWLACSQRFSDAADRFDSAIA
jgi:hypothetical protein